MIGRRVRDLATGDLGTVVEVGGAYGTRYRIDWDKPTPHQHLVWTRVPSQFFDWAGDSGEGE